MRSPFDSTGHHRDLVDEPCRTGTAASTLNDRGPSILAKGHRQPANLRSGFFERRWWPRQGADAASALFMVPERRHEGIYVCPNAHQVIRLKAGAADPAGSVAANLGIAHSKRDK
jgi:hypothetical protein